MATIGVAASLTMGTTVLSLTLEDFIEQGITPAIIQSHQPNNNSRNISGGLKLDKFLFEPKRLWTCNLHLNESKFDLLYLLWDKQESQRNNYQPFNPIVFENKRYSIQEGVFPSTRTLAAGSVNTGTALLGYSDYFSKHNVLLTFPEKFFQPTASKYGCSGLGYIVSFTLEELEKL